MMNNREIINALSEIDPMNVYWNVLVRLLSIGVATKMCPLEMNERTTKASRQACAPRNAAMCMLKITCQCFIGCLVADAVATMCQRNIYTMLVPSDRRKKLDMSEMRACTFTRFKLKVRAKKANFQPVAQVNIEFRTNSARWWYWHFGCVSSFMLSSFWSLSKINLRKYTRYQSWACMNWHLIRRMWKMTACNVCTSDVSLCVLNYRFGCKVSSSVWLHTDNRAQVESCG